MNKKFKLLALFSLVILVIIYFFKSNYITQALLHLNPNINDYTIFENRVVAAKQPKAWRFSSHYTEHQIPIQYLSDFEKYETVAFLIVKDSAIYAEHYWDNYGETTLSNSFSMAKSIVSLLVGCALDDGFIKSIDQPVSDFLPELTSLNSSKLTIRTLLQMSAATNWKESHSSLFSVTTEAYYGDDLWSLMKELKLKGEPGKVFEYQSGVTQLLAYVLQAAVKHPISEYASQRLWTPINAENDALWSLDKEGGMEKAYCCFNSSARDFARIGQLILNKGKWNGRQLISSKYIEEAIRPSKGLLRDDTHRDCSMYGYQFWTMSYKGETIPYMRGILGQYIFIIPSKNAVIVRLGNKRCDQYCEPDHSPQDAHIWLNAAFEILKN